MPIAESNVRETMNSTSNRIDDPNDQWSGRPAKIPGHGEYPISCQGLEQIRSSNLERPSRPDASISSANLGLRSLHRHQSADHPAARREPVAPPSSDLSETARFAPPHTPG